MLVALASLVVVAAGVAYWNFNRREKASDPAPRVGKATGGRFSSVEIRARSGACDAARALEGKRLLAKDAPSLPLPGCTAGKCSCTFTKHADRRTDDRRLAYGGSSTAMFLTTNRRKQRDRRRAKKRG